MDEEGFGWHLPGAANDDGPIQKFLGNGSHTSDSGRCRRDGHQPPRTCRFLRDNPPVLLLQNQRHPTPYRSCVVTGGPALHGHYRARRCAGGGGNLAWPIWWDFSNARSSRRGWQCRWRRVLSKSHRKQHQPPLFTGDLKLETINLFLRKVEHWVRQGWAATGTMESDTRIDSAWRFLDPEVYGWFAHGIHQQGVTVIPPADGSYAPVTGLHFESAFRHRFVPAVAVTAVRKGICALRYCKGVGQLAHFNTRFSNLIRMLQEETTMTREDPLCDEFCLMLPARITEQIIASAHMQKKPQPATLVTLADAMDMVGEFSERTTSHPAVRAPIFSRLTLPLFQRLLVWSRWILL